MAALTVALAASAGAAQAASGEVAARTLDGGTSAVLDYWTPERMASARSGSELLDGVAAPSGVLSGLLGASPARRASAQAIGDASAAPYRTHGKVFFHLPSGNYQCSATVVRSANRRLVVTAGHCIFGDGAFATNWMFIPGKEGGQEPYGRWVAKRIATTRAWKSSEDMRYDVGMATMRFRKGRRLQDVVGARGIAFNRGRNLHFEAFGYPAEPPFGGGQLYRCDSDAQGTDTGGQPAPTRIDCDMTGGASGGGWVIGGRRVNSVTSYGYECSLPILCGNPEDGKLFGPYFGSVIKSLYRSQRRRLSAG